MRQLNYTFVPERPLDTPLYRKGWRPTKPRPRPYPKPAASVGASWRQLREDPRPLIPAPPFQNVAVFQDNYGYPPFAAGYVSESDDMEIDTTGPAFIPVVPITTYGIPLIVGYVPELPEAMEVDWEGPSIQTGPSYHPAFNVPLPPVMVENVDAVHFENPHRFVTGAHHTLPPHASFVDPPYDPRQPLFTTQPILNAGVQVVEGNVFVGININAQVPTHPVQPLALNALPVVAVEEHPDDNTELFNELFGDDGEEDEEENIAPWGGDDLFGGHGNDENEDEDEVEIII